ncbi:CPBP family intramembrane glutamic endopeptidase [Brevibacillus daliensis]|uniref:CPBP family intramembrane glutamic endopeptidase n=1 Tax=Brevibacillus daliensis TaxID=2892995 RepID=UPI001E4AF79B|nr:type II CAAX endopeptidase family protein [Brevibacillus daliensis]
MQIHVNWMSKLRSYKWASLLAFLYFLFIATELSSTRIMVSENGMYKIVMLQEVTYISMILIWLNILISVLGGFVFFITSWLDWRKKRFYPYMQTSVSKQDLLYAIAWMHLFNIFNLLIFGLDILPYPLFPAGSVGGIIESASLQLFMFTFCLIWYWGRWQAIGFVKPVEAWRVISTTLVLYLFILVALNYVIAPLAGLLQLSLDSEREQGITNEILSAKQHSMTAVVLSFFITGVFVPIAEEMMFRGVIQTRLVRVWGAFWGIILTSIWFAIIHVDLVLFLPLLTIGLALGYMRHRFQSIWAPIILHCINNLVSVANSYQLFM